MPLQPTPYTPIPYVRDTRTLQDLLGRQGASRARREQERGLASQQMWAQLGQIASGAIGGYMQQKKEADQIAREQAEADRLFGLQQEGLDFQREQHKEEEPLREARLRKTELEIEATEGLNAEAAAFQEAMSAAYQYDPNAGIWKFNRDVLRQVLSQPRDEGAARGEQREFDYNLGTYKSDGVPPGQGTGERPLPEGPGLQVEGTITDLADGRPDDPEPAPTGENYLYLLPKVTAALDKLENDQIARIQAGEERDDSRAQKIEDANNAVLKSAVELAATLDYSPEAVQAMILGFEANGIIPTDMSIQLRNRIGNSKENVLAVLNFLHPTGLQREAVGARVLKTGDILVDERTGKIIAEGATKPEAGPAKLSVMDQGRIYDAAIENMAASMRAQDRGEEPLFSRQQAQDVIERLGERYSLEMLVHDGATEASKRAVAEENQRQEGVIDYRRTPIPPIDRRRFTRFFLDPNPNATQEAIDGLQALIEESPGGAQGLLDAYLEDPIFRTEFELGGADFDAVIDELRRIVREPGNGAVRGPTRGWGVTSPPDIQHRVNQALARERAAQGR
jgi:hypothetical protein